MNVTITAAGNDLKLDFGSGNIEYHSFEDIDHRVADPNLELYKNGKLLHRFTLAEILAPAGADLEAKADAISELAPIPGGGTGGGATILTWGARASLTTDDTGNIEIAANASRKGVRISNSNDKDVYYTLNDEAPVWEEDIKLSKKETHFFFEGEAGQDAIRFINKSGENSTITYQEAT